MNDKDIRTIILAQKTDGITELTHRNVEMLIMARKINASRQPKWESKTVSGSIVTVSDAIKPPNVIDLKVAVNATQSGSGTPSPDNVRPIIGVSEVNAVRCGVNLWDEEWELGGYWNDTGLPRPLTDRIRCKNAIPIKQNTEIYTPYTMAFLFYDKNGNVLASVARAGYSRADNMYLRQSSNTEGKFLIPSGVYYMRFYMQNTYGTTYNNDISINYPATDKDYHAYDGQLYTINLGNTYYGGVLDVVSGKLMPPPQKAIIIDENSSINMPYQAYIKSDATDFFVQIPDVFPKTSPGGQNPIKYMCSHCSFAIANIWQYTGYPNRFTVNQTQLHINLANDVLGITDYQTETTASAKTKVLAYLANNPITVVYPIEQSGEVQLTPTEVELAIRQNTIYADSGDIELTYKAKKGE